jgi:hypothetical protein
MKFSEIANRLTGISAPLVGVSWQPTDLEVSAARRVIEGKVYRPVEGLEPSVRELLPGSSTTP